MQSNTKVSESAANKIAACKNQNSLTTTVSAFTSNPVGVTTHPGKRFLDRGSFTGLYGLRRMDQFQTDLRSITRTKTGQKTRSRISSAFRRISTKESTCLNEWPTQRIGLLRLRRLTLVERRQKSGIRPRLALPGIQPTARPHGMAESRLCASAPYAGETMSHSSRIGRSSAPCPAARVEATKNKRQSRRCALFAGLGFWPTSTGTSSVARKSAPIECGHQTKRQRENA